MTVSTFEVQFKRKRKHKTNYRKRLALLLAKKPRVVARKTNKNNIVQIINFFQKGDKTVCSATSFELKKIGWSHGTSNTCAAYFAGMLCGKRALRQGITEGVFDIGLHSSIHGSRIFACLKGIIDAGIKVPVGENIFPKQERLFGMHLKKKVSKEEFEKFAKKLDELAVKAI